MANNYQIGIPDIPSPLSSASQLLHDTTNPIPELPQPFPTLVPQTANENLLFDAFHKREKHAEGLQCQVLELQAANVLNEMYCSMLWGQPAHYEKKKNTPKGVGKLVGDGLPNFMSRWWNLQICRKGQS
jgi:hypothetical protein